MEYVSGDQCKLGINSLIFISECFSTVALIIMDRLFFVAVLGSMVAQEGCLERLFSS